MKPLIGLLFGTLLLQASSVSAQDAGDRPKPPGKEVRLKRVTEKLQKALQLNASQQQKVTTAYSQFFTEMEKLRGDKMPPPPPPPPPADKAKVDALVKKRDAQIKSILTTAQFQQYIEIEKTMRPPAPGKGPGEAPPKQ